MCRENDGEPNRTKEKKGRTTTNAKNKVEKKWEKKPNGSAEIVWQTNKQLFTEKSLHQKYKFYCSGNVLRSNLLCFVSRWLVLSLHFRFILLVVCSVIFSLLAPLFAIRNKIPC